MCNTWIYRRHNVANIIVHTLGKVSIYILKNNSRPYPGLLPFHTSKWRMIMGWIYVRFVPDIRYQDCVLLLMGIVPSLNHFDAQRITIVIRYQSTIATLFANGYKFIRRFLVRYERANRIYCIYFSLIVFTMYVHNYLFLFFNASFAIVIIAQIVWISINNTQITWFIKITLYSLIIEIFWNVLHIQMFYHSSFSDWIQFALITIVL